MEEAGHDAALQFNERARFLGQVPRGELLTIEETVGWVMGEVSAADPREPHAAPAPALGPQKRGVMFQCAFGRRWLSVHIKKWRSKSLKTAWIKIYSA
jgi:hypothetical protein